MHPVNYAAELVHTRRALSSIQYYNILVKT